MQVLRASFVNLAFDITQYILVLIVFQSPRDIVKYNLLISRIAKSSLLSLAHAYLRPESFILDLSAGDGIPTRNGATQPDSKSGACAVPRNTVPGTSGSCGGECHR